MFTDSCRKKSVKHQLTLKPIRMAYYEIRLILAKVFWHFDLKLADGFELEDWDDSVNYQTYVIRPLQVKAVPVKR